MSDSKGAIGFMTTLKSIGESAARLAANSHSDVKELAEMIGKIVELGGGPQGPPGPPGPPGRGLDDLSVAGAYRAKLQSLFELLVALQVEGRAAGLSTGARRALKKARRYVKKAAGAIVTEDETGAGQVIKTSREARRLERKAKKDEEEEVEENEEEEEIEEEEGED
jgi:hypothetical protein